MAIDTIAAILNMSANPSLSEKVSGFFDDIFRPPETTLLPSQGDPAQWRIPENL